MPNLQFVQLGAIPKFEKYVNKGGWLSYGINNTLAYELISLYNNSSKHNALITSKVSYILGKGLKAKEIVSKRIENRPNFLETINELAEKVITDQELFGGFYLQLVFSSHGGNLVDIYHLPFQNVMPSENASKFLYADDFNKNGLRNGVEFDRYTGKNEGTKILYIKKYRAGSTVLAMPEYFASLKYIKIDTEIANYHYNNITSGFAAGTMVVLYTGDITDEEKNKITKNFKEKSTGSDNTGGVFIHFSSNINDPEPKVIPLNSNNLTERFDQLNLQVRDEIFIGHKVISKILFGISVEGALGGRNEIIEAFNLFNESYIKPKQKLVTDTFNLLAKINGGVGDFTIETAPPIDLDYAELFAFGLIDKKTAQEKLGLPITIDVLPNQPKTSLIIADAIEFSKHGFDANDFEEMANVPIKMAIAEQDRRALNVIKQSPLIDTATLINLLNLDSVTGTVLIENLVAEKLITTDRGLQVSEKGILEIRKMSKTELFIMYQYSGPQDDKNRDFCAELLKLNRMYSKKDISNISLKLEYDVWKMRGGWYHNPDLDVNIPHCRHEWRQVIVRKKIN